MDDRLLLDSARNLGIENKKLKEILKNLIRFLYGMLEKQPDRILLKFLNQINKEIEKL